jgi:2-oxoglutarate ferredoxin oxidoreductase subunit gamma
MKALSKVLPERYHHLLPLNEQALMRGRELVEHETKSEALNLES